MLDAERMIRVQDATAALYRLGSVDAMVSESLRVLCELIDADWAGIVLNLTSLPVTRRLWSSGGVDLSAAMEASDRLVDTNPLYGARLRRLIDRPATLGEFLTDGELGDNAYFVECLKGNGVRRLLNFVVPGSFNYGLICVRSSGADFSMGDAVVMHAVGRHIDAATSAQVARDGGRLVLDGRPVPFQRFSWLVFDDEGRILRSDPHSRAAMGVIEPGAVRRGVLPPEWMDRLRLRIAGAPPTPIVGERGGEVVSVYVAPIRTNPGEHSAVFLTEPDPSADPWRSAGLTARESEILGWVAAGKTNPQIAELLGISPLTVKKHAERVFEKLGVTNRAAATARAMELMGGC
jgi:DNA-binding CsgD family transcriptional regulator